LLIYSVSFLAVFFIGTVIDLACGPEPDPYDYYISFFHNNIQKTDDYWPFYFNGFAFLNDDKNQVSEQAVNAGEWAVYLGGMVKPGDVQRVIYGLTDSVESTLYNKYLIYKKLPDSLHKNTFLKKLISKSGKPALLYYLFSESLEHVTKNRGDRWNPEALDTVSLTKKAMKAVTRAEKEADSFLKLRYYYQAQRLLHYSGNMRAALEIYKEHFEKNHSNSHVMGWALSLKAGE
jgi:hypothetical protein